jgi:hypothetical protein
MPETERKPPMNSDAEAAQHFPGRFNKVNFASEKHDMGFALMNQRSVIEKRFPKCHSDIAADYFALRKTHRHALGLQRSAQLRQPRQPLRHRLGRRPRHRAHKDNRCEVSAAVCHETCWFDGRQYHPYKFPSGLVA